MNVRLIQPDAELGMRRGGTVVCIPVYGAHERFVACLRSVLAHTPPGVPVLVCDDASPDERSRQFVRGLDGDADPRRSPGPDRDLLYLRRERNLGFPANVNGAFALCAPADVVVINSDCVVAEGWLEGLRDAAYSDSRVATATALTNNGTIVSVPGRGRASGEPAPGWTLDAAAAAIRRRSLRLRPRLPTAIGHCVFFRRSALDLVGGFDLAFSPGYGEEVDFSQRCLRIGLSHLLADDVFVLHHGGASFQPGGGRSPHQQEHERLLAARYPHYHRGVQELERDPSGPLARALSVARRAIEPLSVLVDARVLEGPTTGTHVHVLELLAALGRAGRARITAVVPDAPSHDVARALGELGEVELLTRGQLERSGLRVDLVHRPFQVDYEGDLGFLGRLGERLLVTHQDLISYHNPSYFRSAEAWLRYRVVTRATLALADRVVFVSEHARAEALAEELVEPGRASVVHNGVEHLLVRAGAAPSAPPAGRRLEEGAEVILCIGTDFRHKNRLFALRMLEALRRRHGLDARLVLAGPAVTCGSSRDEERDWLARHPSTAEAVIDCGAVSEAEKEWLYRRAALVVYPSVHEGFGLIPFEAAARGTPCMWAQGTSLGEVLPQSGATIVQWDAERSAERALELLRDERSRRENVSTIQRAAAGLTWDAAAGRLLELYERTCDEPPAPGSRLERRGGLLDTWISEDARRLIGPSGALPHELERPLLALATHPQVGRPVFRAIEAGYRVGHRLRRWRRR